MNKAASARILIVEDDGPLLEVLQYVLEDAGYRVLTAEDGPAALKLAADQVDLVLLDVGLVRMNGFEVARALRASEATAKVAIAFHTGMDEAAVRSNWSDYDLFLPKADDAELLLKSIDSLITARRQAAVSA